MYRLLARRRARVRASALRIGSIDHSRVVACPDSGFDASPAQHRYHFDYATRYAALSPTDDKPSGDRGRRRRGRHTIARPLRFDHPES
jgi:hypothetical protein